MSDDKMNRGSADRSRINIHEDYERRYWAKKLGISEEELKAVVQEVGPMVKDVEKELAEGKPH